MTRRPRADVNNALRAALTLAFRKGNSMLAFIYDTETTGLIENRTVHLDKQPHMIEFFGHLVDLASGEVVDEYGTLIKPPIPLPLRVKGDKGIAEMTGITEAMLVGQPRFADVRGEIKTRLERAPRVIAHNLSFDKDMVEVEFERLKETVAWPRKLTCTVEQTIHMRGHRLTLTRLHNLLFPGETFVAHRAQNDVKALTRCCVELFRREIL